VLDSALPAPDGSLASTVWLAVIQGLTEFLPISSSGHLVLGSALLGVEEGVQFQTVALHVGTLLAVLAVYRRDLLRLVDDARGGRWRELGLLAVGTVPAVVVGLGLHDFLSGLFESPTAAAIGLILTACILVAGERARRRSRRALPPGVAGEEKRLSWPAALGIGCAQAFAILPGVSRSGSTIAAGLGCGLDARQAARFSFLLSIPAIGGAALLEGLSALEGDVGAVPWSELGIGMAVSAVVGWASLRVLLAFLGRGVFHGFAVYCAALGVGWLLFG
jgi:undecaprenyl-diphosphatase